MDEKNIAAKNSPFIPFLLLIFTVLILFVWQYKKNMGSGVDTRDRRSVEFPQMGFLAPDFSLPDIKDNKVTLSAHRGKIIFINFWATWCPTCDEEMASMEKLYRTFKEGDFEMLTINIDKKRSPVDNYIEKNRLTFPVLLDPKNSIGKRYQTTGVPETFILDKSGVIIQKIIGPRDWSKKESIALFRRLIEG